MRQRAFVRYLIICLSVLFGTLSVVRPVAADGLSEEEFWSRLQRTDSLLQKAITQPDQRDSTGAEIRKLWEKVDSVRLRNNKTVAIDTCWLVQASRETYIASLQEVNRYVQALIAARSRNLTIREQTDSLNALDRVLQESRFQYLELPPKQARPACIQPETPAPQPTRTSPEGAEIPAEFFQMLILLAGIVGGAVILFSVIRHLLRLPTRIVQKEAAAEEPTTSTEASSKAGQSVQALDYRNAIRYQYLACLLSLDERGLLRYDRSLTNWEHLRLTENKPRLYQTLEPVVDIFDRVWYGFASIDEASYRSFLENVEQLKRLTL